MQWLDSRLKTNLAQDNNKIEAVVISPAAIDHIWFPDLHILNRQSFKSKEEWASLITTRIFKNKGINRLEGKNTTKYELSIPTVEMKYDIKTKVHCMNWKYNDYPRDTQTCNVTFGSASASSVFTLLNKPEYPSKTSYTSADFDITIQFFDENLSNGSNHVGITISMERLMTPFIFKYYAPCIAIVLVSGIGFIIPPSAIPGRISLLATLFLTMVNLFIHEMVSNFKCYNYTMMTSSKKLQVIHKKIF